MKRKKESLSAFLIKLKKQKFLLLITVPFIFYLFLFSYLPIFGWIWSFFDFRPGIAITMDDFVGFKHYKELFSDDTFWLALRNTLVLSALNLILGTFFAVSFAVLLNEIKTGIFKKFTQVVSYLPHFVSWVVVAGIFINLLKLTGTVNRLLLNTGILKVPYAFLLEGKLYWILISLLNIWKETGWSAIIYLAVMSGINFELYEAAYIDGAGRWKRIWHITLTSIRKTIIVLLVINIGWILGIGLEQNLLLGNAANFDYSEVLASYIYRYGLKSREYSFGMAASVFQSLTSFILVMGANFLSKKMNDTAVF